MRSGTLGIVDGRHEAACQVLETLEAVQRVRGLDRDALDRPRVLLEAPRRPHHRAGRAEPGDEVRQAVADARRGSRAPCRRSGRASWTGSSTGRDRSTCPGPSRRCSRAWRMAPSEPSIGSLKMISVPKLCAMSLRALLTFDGMTRRTRIAERGAEDRVGDAGVAARRVDEDLVARQPAVRQRVEHHPERGAVLDAAAGVRELELRPHLDVGHVAVDLPQAHERRVADGVDDRLEPAAARRDDGAHVRPSRMAAERAQRLARAAGRLRARTGSRNPREASSARRRDRRRPRVDLDADGGSTASAAAASAADRARAGGRRPPPRGSESPPRPRGRSVATSTVAARDPRLARSADLREPGLTVVPLHRLSPRRWPARC